MAKTMAAGWMPDPSARHQLRYWDGSAWTDHVSDQGVTSSDPIARPSTRAEAPATPPTARPNVPPPRRPTGTDPSVLTPGSAHATTGPSGLLLEVTSHEEGRNSKVRVFGDRIEREKAKAMTSFSRARQDAEVIPLRSVSSVQAKKDGVMYTKVTVFATGNTIVFRLRHEEAQQLKEAITRLLLAPPPAAAPVDVRAAPSAAPVLSKVEQLRELAQLRDEGILSAEEFDAEKGKILRG